jgi:preprotein translocase subunit SecF
MIEWEVPEVDYTRYSNRQLLVVPLALFAAAVLVLAVTWAVTGSPVVLGIDFTGGSELTVETSLSSAEIAGSFESDPVSVQPVVDESDTFVVTFQATDLEALQDQAETAGMEVRAASTTSAAFAEDSQLTAIVGVLIAFAAMSLLVFGLFRTFVPSIAVVISALSDIVIPLGVLALFQIPLSLGTVAALLMLIGYSVDSDILLNNHVLRRSGEFYESVYRAMETGVTMTLTSIAAMAVMTVLATLFGIGIMASIGLVLVIGLIADLLNTYMLNLTLLRWYKYEGVNR